MDNATLIMLMAISGIVLLVVWTIYRIQGHKKKMREFDESAMEIGRMSKKYPQSGREPEPSAPSLPQNDLLIVMFRSRSRPWRGVVSHKIKEGGRVVVVSSRPPEEVRRMYPKGFMHLWLDRSTAHDVGKGTTVINPTNLSSILEEIRSRFSGGNMGGTVVFEGFEDVLSNNATDRVIRFLKMLEQISKDRGLSSVVPLPYKAVPQRVRNQLVDGFDSVVID
ncbi:MAG: hypothetical protein JW939_01165 [Candidatus Thermoplasmatota archaeon]|nr:hypothetical protein [Candidatus Thermoplasmatota archaeon]